MHCAKLNKNRKNTLNDITLEGRKSIPITDMINIRVKLVQFTFNIFPQQIKFHVFIKQNHVATSLVTNLTRLGQRFALKVKRKTPLCDVFKTSFAFQTDDMDRKYCTGRIKLFWMYVKSIISCNTKIDFYL